MWSNAQLWLFIDYKRSKLLDHLQNLTNFMLLTTYQVAF